MLSNTTTFGSHFERPFSSPLHDKGTLDTGQLKGLDMLKTSNLPYEMKSKVCKVLSTTTFVACTTFLVMPSAASNHLTTDSAIISPDNEFFSDFPISNSVKKLGDLYTLLNQAEIFEYLSENFDLVSTLIEINSLLVEIYGDYQLILKQFTDEELVTKLYVIAKVEHDDFDLMDQLEDETFERVLLPYANELSGRVIFSQA